MSSVSPVMHEIAPNLSVGAESACHHGGDGTAVIHACKHPCHQRAVGYQGTLPSNHPEYLIACQETDLYLNMVDMDQKLAHRFTGPIMDAALDFIDEHIADRRVVVHCNQGLSRSPSIALVYLAKRAGELTDANYDEAASEFRGLYPGYQPGRGLQLYLQDHWTDLR